MAVGRMIQMVVGWQQIQMAMGWMQIQMGDNRSAKFVKKGG
jgi:hypothetical protein